MSNSRRFHLPSIPQHIVQRGNNRQACFLVEEDYTEYVGRLAAAARKFGVAIHAYALMSNHVHLLASPSSAGGIAKMMQAVGGGYVRCFNTRHHRTGTLWDGRYFSSLVGGDSYFWNCHRYIELNPVRAGMVGRPGDYRWSSHARNAHGRPDPLVSPHPAYMALGSSGDAAQRAYRQFFETMLPEETIEEIRRQLHRERAFGDEEFLARIESRTQRSPRVQRAGRRISKVEKC